MIAVHLAVFATAAGRTWGLDGILRPIVADRPGASARWYRRCS
jgi:thiosulfate dehydrogenase [quinone] large subunit